MTVRGTAASAQIGPMALETIAHAAYTSAYVVAYGVVYAAMFVVQSMPQNNPIMHGVCDGGRAAMDGLSGR